MTYHLPTRRDLLPLVRAAGLAAVDAVPYAEREFAAYARTREGAQFSRWQDAWNAFTRASADTIGYIDVTYPVCPECEGRGYSTASGSLVWAATHGRVPGTCRECDGRGHLHSLRILASVASESASV